MEEEQTEQGQPEDDVIEETMFTFESFELVRGYSGALFRVGPLLTEL